MKTQEQLIAEIESLQDTILNLCYENARLRATLSGAVGIMDLMDGKLESLNKSILIVRKAVKDAATKS